MPVVVLLIVVALVFKFFWWLVALGVVVAAGHFIVGWLARRDSQAAARRSWEAEVCARADRQHAAVLSGDELVGVYGEYPPCA